MNKIFNVLIGFLENICFLLSSMTLFLLFYSVKCFVIIFDDKDFSINEIKNLWEHKQAFCIFSIIIFGLAFLGLIVTIIFMRIRQDNSNEENGDALIFEKDSLVDKIDNYYFSKFSLFVLTGLSLPQKSLTFSIILLILFCISIGIVYLKNDMFFVNPILSLFGYKFYSGKPTNKNYNKKDEIILLIKGNEVPSKIHIKNLNQKVYFIKY